MSKIEKKSKKLLTYKGLAVYFTFEKPYSSPHQFIYSTDPSGSMFSLYAFDVRRLENIAKMDVSDPKNHPQIISEAISGGKLTFPPEVLSSVRIRQETAIKSAMCNLQQDSEKLDEVLQNFYGDEYLKNGLEVCIVLMEKTRDLLDLVRTNSME